MNRFVRREVRANVRQIKTHGFALLHLLFGKRRTSQDSLSEYSRNWAALEAQGADFQNLFEPKFPMTRFNKPVAMSVYEWRRTVITHHLARFIESTGAKRILEIGSGFGFNLLLLAPRFPDRQFVGIEPTDTGVRISKAWLAEPPGEFREASSAKPLLNVEIELNDILTMDTGAWLETRGGAFDFVFTTAVLEQLHNEIDVALRNIFRLTSGHFCFFEEFLEANTAHYLDLVKWDYFRHSWDILHEFADVEIIERFIPEYQPSWLKYAFVFGRRTSS
ncbi:MAG: class I SAM-dependent methyltransferase [Candidatus Hydrogenedentes bacterium]|nr:class I SAM-dependent methyltransferase [Candidatus Hydrogenedentota bacterium]